MEFKNTGSIIFDLDGTLWDASLTCTEAWNVTLKLFGLENVRPDAAIIRSFSGLKIDEVLRQFFPFITADQQDAFLELYKINEQKLMQRYGGHLFAGVQEVLEDLSKKFKLFIVSNCLKGYIENFIAFNGFQHLFTDFESSGNTGLAKSDNITLITERNQLTMPVYIGDTKWDYEAAQKNKIPFIYAAYGFGTLQNFNPRIQRFGELKNFFQQVSVS